MNKILLFAHLRDQIGKTDLLMDVAGISVKNFKEILKESYAFEEVESVMVAINEEFAGDDEIISMGDIIALIPPVSGG